MVDLRDRRAEPESREAAEQKRRTREADERGELLTREREP